VALFQSLGIVTLFVVTSSNHASYRIMASPTRFRISPGTSSGPIDLFLPVAASCFLIILILVVKDSPKGVGISCGMFFSQLNTEEWGVGLSVESVISLPLQSLIAGILYVFP